MEEEKIKSSYQLLAKEGYSHRTKDLPPDVEAVANLRGRRVLAWTTVDPAADIGCYACGHTFGKFLILPCFWPHMILLSPCLSIECLTLENQLHSQYWILTETDVKIVEMEYDACPCLPWCFRVGSSVKTIPLDRITDCGHEAKGNGLANMCCCVNLSQFYVDTAGNGSKGHDAMGIGLLDSDMLLDAILDQRDRLLGRTTSRESSVSNHVMDRGDVELTSTLGGGKIRGGNIVERMKTLEMLKSQNLISLDEYEQKRSEILSDV